MEQVKLGKDSYCFCLLSAGFCVRYCALVLRGGGGGSASRRGSQGLPRGFCFVPWIVRFSPFSCAGLLIVREKIRQIIGLDFWFFLLFLVLDLLIQGLQKVSEPYISCVTMFKFFPLLKKDGDELWPLSIFLWNYPTCPLWAPIAREPKIPFSSEQEMLLFVAGTIRHRDRKQILIIIWTHRGEKKKKSLMGHSKMIQNCKTAKHGGSLCPLPVPRNVARLMTRGGVGEVNDITGCVHIWILTQWHLVFLFTPPPPPRPPPPPVSEAWIVLGSAFSFPLKEYLLFSSSS